MHNANAHLSVGDCGKREERECERGRGPAGSFRGWEDEDETGRKGQRREPSVRHPDTERVPLAQHGSRRLSGNH